MSRYHLDRRDAFVVLMTLALVGAVLSLYWVSRDNAERAHTEKQKASTAKKDARAADDRADTAAQLAEYVDRVCRAGGKDAKTLQQRKVCPRAKAIAKKEADAAASSAGRSGPTGPIGPVGPVGPPGTEGGKGGTGNDGKDGTAGSDGRNGSSGSDGFNGLDGSAGATGPVGPAGPPGSSGGPGPKGDKGDKGDTGPPGADGAGVPTDSAGCAAGTYVSSVSISPAGLSVTCSPLPTRPGRD